MPLNACMTFDEQKVAKNVDKPFRLEIVNSIRQVATKCKLSSENLTIVCEDILTSHFSCWADVNEELYPGWKLHSERVQICNLAR